jgi:hypothetical protein
MRHTEHGHTSSASFFIVSSTASNRKGGLSPLA